MNIAVLIPIVATAWAIATDPATRTAREIEALRHVS
jgi:hypothetical protein